MTLLLDIHAFLWILEKSERLSPQARAAVNDPANQVRLSVASLWEITIKVSLGKLVLPGPWPETLRQVEALTPDLILPITPKHLEALLGLPWPHRDPFDRILVAQALSENMILVSGDSIMDAYGVQRLW